MENKIYSKILKALLVLVSVIFIFLVCYLFGWELLQAPFTGNEFTFVIAMSKWVDAHLFQGIQWYPFHGGGGSVTQATQIGVYYWITLLHRLTGLSLGQATRLTAFLLIFLVSCEIYLFVWWKFKSQSMALLASFFFPLSQAAWVEVLHAGILAQPSSVLFILPTIFLFDLFLRERKIKVFVLTVFSFGLCFFAHILTTELMVGVLFVWALVFPFLFSFQKKWDNLKFSLSSWLLVTFLGSLLVSFWILPFWRYQSVVSRNLIPFKAIEQIGYITFPYVLGFGDAWGGRSNIDVSFALPVLIFACLGILMAIIRKDKLVILLSLFSVGFLLYLGLPFLAPWFVKIFFMDLVSQTYERAFVFPVVLIPILASYGLVQISRQALFWIRGTVKVFFVSLLAIFLAILGLVFLEHVPPNAVPCYFGLGPWFGTRIDYCNFLAKLKDIKFVFGEDTLPFESGVKYILEKTGVGAKNRLDISPLNGGLVMAWPLYSESSTVNLQLNTASLNNIFWGYQVGAFYQKHEFGSAQEVANLSSWFGIEYLVLDPSSPIEKYTDQYWQDVVDDRSLIIKRFKGPAGMTTLSSSPKILVLGNFKNRAYEQFFRLAAAGAYPYGKAIFVEGKDSGRIDDYTLEELKKFETILLYGYTYKNKEKAFSLLEQYVKEGGRLFIETGWQYVNPDWQMEKTPEVIPLKKLFWKEFKGDWGLDGFSPAEYKGGPWGVSTGLITELKNWAQPNLVLGDDVLVASGNLGKGKVVWSGMNLIGHSFTYRDPDEFAFIERQLDWLLADLGGNDKTFEIDFRRINPDKIEFTFSKPQERVWLYWRENFFPDWQAWQLRTMNHEQRTKLPIYRAGPNFILIPLEKVGEGDKVILELKKSKTFILSRIISLATLLFLLTLLVNDKIFLTFGKKISNRFSPQIGQISKWWEKEE